MRGIGVAVLKLVGGLVVTAILPGIGYLIYAFVDMRAELKLIPDRIKFEVASKMDEAKKEYASDVKQTREELERFKTAVEFDRVIADQVCQGAYQAAITAYATYTTHVHKDFPDSLKPSIYRNLLISAVRSGNSTLFTEAELDKIDAVIRKRQAVCGTSSLVHLAILYAANGHIEKARVANLAALEVMPRLLDTLPCSGGDHGVYYAVHLLIELGRHRDKPVKEQLDLVWQTLKQLQTRSLIESGWIHSAIDVGDARLVAVQLSLLHSPRYAEALDELKRKLQKRTFRKEVKVKKLSDGRELGYEEITEVDADPPPVMPNPSRFPAPKPVENKGPAPTC